MSNSAKNLMRKTSYNGGGFVVLTRRDSGNEDKIMFLNPDHILYATLTPAGDTKIIMSGKLFAFVVEESILDVGDQLRTARGFNK